MAVAILFGSFILLLILRVPIGISLGMSSLLANVAMGWHQNKASYEKTAAIVTDRMERLAHSVHPTQPTARLWENQFQRLRSSFDREFGGFGEAPKFPSPQICCFCWNTTVIPATNWPCIWQN